MFQMVASLLFQMEIEQLSLDLHRDNVVGLLEVNHESVEAPTRITPPPEIFTFQPCSWSPQGFFIHRVTFAAQILAPADS